MNKLAPPRPALLEMLEQAGHSAGPECFSYFEIGATDAVPVLNFAPV